MRERRVGRAWRWAVWGALVWACGCGPQGGGCGAKAPSEGVGATVAKSAQAGSSQGEATARGAASAGQATEPNDPAEGGEDERARFPVVDVHTHIGAGAYGLALELAAAHGIERVVNLSGGHAGRRGGLAPHVEAIGRWPGRVAVFYNVDWREHEAPGWGEAQAKGLEDAVKAGYAGLKISKALGLGVQNDDGSFLAVDDPRLDPIWAKAGELGVPVAIHTGDPKAFFEPIGPDNERLEELKEAPSWSFADPKFPRREVLLAQRDRMLAKHRATTFILVHFGNNPEDLAYAAALLERHPNAVLDTSARLAEIGRHDPEKVREVFVRYKDRILFGTDMGVHARRSKRDGRVYGSLFLGSISKQPPGRDDAALFLKRHWAFFERDPAKTGPMEHPVPIQGDWKIRPIGLPDAVLRAVYYDNAYRLVFAPMFKRRGIADPYASTPPDDDGDAQPK